MNAESAGGKVFDEEIDDAIDGTRKVRVGNVSQRKRLYVVWRRNPLGDGSGDETKPTPNANWKKPVREEPWRGRSRGPVSLGIRFLNGNNYIYGACFM